MFGIFKCKHPAHKLVVLKDSTIKPKDDDFSIVTHHLYCQNCGKSVDIKYAQMIGGVKSFLDRGRQQYENSKLHK